MATTATNIILYDDYRRVTIATVDITKNYTKALTNLAIPVGPDQQDKADPLSNYNTKTLDLLSKLEKRVTITGHLVTGYSTTDGEGTDTNHSASAKCIDLEKLFFAGGYFYVTGIPGETDAILKACIDKLEIKKIANDASDITSHTFAVAEYEVQISLIIVVGNLVGN